MPSGKQPSALFITLLSLCFFAKIVFYCSFVPLWEGYDEFAHYAFAGTLQSRTSFPMREARCPAMSLHR